MTIIQSDCQNEDPINILADECDREARQAIDMVPPGHGPVAAHYRKYARAIIEAYAARLQDPATVHANMLRGAIAKISMVQCAHTHGVQFNDLEAAEAKLAEVSQERDRLREALAEIAKQKTRDEVDCPKDVDWALAYGWVVEDARAALNKEPS